MSDKKRKTMVTREGGSVTLSTEKPAKPSTKKGEKNVSQ